MYAEPTAVKKGRYKLTTYLTVGGVIMSEKKKRSEYMKMLKAYPELLRIEQLCEILGGISTKTGYKLLKDGKISSMKVGREYRVTKVDLVNYLLKKI